MNENSILSISFWLNKDRKRRKDLIMSKLLDQDLFPLQTEDFVISKKNFTYGQYLQGSVGQETWAFPLLHVWDLDQRGHLSGPAYSLPSCYFRSRLCLCSLFVMVASKSLAKSVTVFSFGKGGPWHPERPNARLDPRELRWNLTLRSFFRTLNWFGFLLWLRMFHSLEHTHQASR